MRRGVVALIVGSMLAYAGVASATSLGAFQVAGYGETVPGADVLCSVADPATDVDFLTGGLLPIALADLGLLSDVENIELSGLSGYCVDMRPVVVVIGSPDGISPDEVLSRTMLDPLAGTTTVTLAVDVTDEVNSLLGLLAAPSEVRVGFCPVGQTGCEP